MTPPDATALLQRVSACPTCRQRWLSDGALQRTARAGGQGRALAAVTVMALLLAGFATVPVYRDPGSLLAITCCVAAAVMVIRDRARRLPRCRHGQWA